MYSDGHLTLFDLSVAKEFDPAHPFRDNAGTRDYMAPEQARRERVGYATDVYGLGVVFYQLLTGGRMPYPTVEQPSDEDASGKKRVDYDSPLAPPGQFDPNIPVGIDAVAVKALALYISERYQTPADFKAALDAALEK